MWAIPSYTEIERLVSLAQKYWEKFTYERKTQRFNKAHESFKNPFLSRFLSWKYSHHNVLNVSGTIYPVVVFPTPKYQERDLESILSKALHRSVHDPEKFVVVDPHFRALAGELGLPLVNRITYTMARLNYGGKLQLLCELGYYYYTLDTCFSLYWEILSNLDSLVESGQDNFRRFDEELKLRQVLHEVVGDPVTDGSRRSVAIGISTLIAYNDGKGIKLWVKRRSMQGVAVYPGLVNVLPSGMFQPLVCSFDEEFSIRHNLYREYLEEIFDRPEVYGEEAYDYFYEDTRLERLFKLVGRGQAELFLTGVAVDLLSLRPEICTLLLIGTPEWFGYHSKAAQEQERFKLSLEFMKGSADRGPLEGQVTPIPFSRDDRDLLQYKFLSPFDITPSGAGAFWLGVNKLREIL